MVGGRAVLVDTYPDFRVDPEKVAAAITPRTKLILVNSPGNPTGAVASEEPVRALAELAEKQGVALLSDEIYRSFCYDGPLASPAPFNDATIVVDGLSKSHGVTGWRLGWVHGPREIIDKMTAVQQYTFVCAPHPLQHGAVAALDVDQTQEAESYRRRRDLVVAGLLDAGYQVTAPGGAFYVFPEVPQGGGTGSQFVARAIEKELLIIPGSVFSRRDTHFRISYAASEATIERGLEVLKQ